MLIIQTVFFLINFKVYTYKNVQVLQVTSDNVYKFINTARKKGVLGFLWILSFSLHFL